MGNDMFENNIYVPLKGWYHLSDNPRASEIDPVRC